MAGGDFGAAWALSPGSLVAWMGKNDFWSDELYQGGDGWMFQHIAVGSLAITAPGVAPGNVSATQTLKPSLVNMSAAGVGVIGGFVGARTRTMVLPLEATASVLNLTLAVSNVYPAKAPFGSFRGPLPTAAGTNGSMSWVVRRNNYARYAPAVLGPSSVGAGLLKGTRALRLLPGGKVEARTDAPFQQATFRPGAQCLAPLPPGERLAPWANASSLPVVSVACASAPGAWTLPSSGNGGTLQWKSGTTTLCAQVVDGATVTLGPCSSSQSQGWALSPAPGATDWQWLCRSSGTAGCLVSVPEMSDRDVALVMKVVARGGGGSWADVAPTAREVSGTSTVSSTYAVTRGTPMAVIVQAATAMDYPGLAPPPPPPGSRAFPALALATAELSAVSDPSPLRASHDAWWEAWWATTAINLVPESSSCPAGAAPASFPAGCVLDGFVAGMDWMRGATASEGKVLPSLWGPFNNADPSNWRDDVTIDYNVEANLFAAAALGRHGVYEPYIRFSKTLFNSSSERARVNWTEPGGPHHPAPGFGTVDVARTVTRASLGHQSPDSFEGLEATNSAGPFSGQSFYTDWGNRWPAAMFAAPLIELAWFAPSNATRLKEDIYPWVSGAADFYASFALPSPHNSSWMDIYPSCGQESCSQRTGGKKPPYELQVTADLGLAHLVLSQAVALAAEAGMTNTTRLNKWKSVLGSLPPFALVPASSSSSPPSSTSFVVASGVNPDGGELPPEGNYNTPLVNTMPVYPGRAVTRATTNKTVLDAFNLTAWTLGTRAAWKPQNGLCSAWPAAARLCDNEHCGESLLVAFEGALTASIEENFWPSLGGGGLEQMGAVDGVLNLLVDVESEAVAFFPAWDTARFASFSGVRTRFGDFAVSAETGPAFKQASVNASAAGTFSFMVSPFSSPSPVVQDVTAGKPVATSAGPTPGSLSFAAEQGHAYTISG